MAWQKGSGYNQRAKVEASIGRWKQVIGDGLRSRIGGGRPIRAKTYVSVLHAMLWVGLAAV
jgi:hypothetical protein